MFIRHRLQDRTKVVAEHLLEASPLPIGPQPNLGVSPRSLGTERVINKIDSEAPMPNDGRHARTMQAQKYIERKAR